MENEKMTFEEYKKRNEEYRKSIDSIRNSMKELLDKYLKEHQEFQIGDKVHCWYKRSWDTDELRDLGLAFIGGLDGIDYNGSVKYKYFKVKKDGTMSAQSAGFWSVDKIELVK